ncbi:LmbU family transcriptional regulator [Streptomyces mirabilis]|uniref:LmbU family transcriptional regulator n=1 Tax=Streptomyces mirabilis TaxID=68239 RepID=UPI002F919A21
MNAATGYAPRKPLAEKQPDPSPRARRIIREDVRGAEVLTTRVGLHIPEGLKFESWEKAGHQLAGVVDSCCWWLGDWLVYGKDHYADRYERGIMAAGLKYQTLRNYAWVSRRFVLSRRRSGLSFQHHAEVASFPLDQQERWLDEAERKRWSTKQLRQAIKKDRRVENGGAEDTSVSIRRLEVPDSRFKRWHEAAEQVGVDVERWVLTTLDNAAEKMLDDNGTPMAGTELKEAG